MKATKNILKEEGSNLNIINIIFFNIKYISKLGVIGLWKGNGANVILYDYY